MSAESQLRSLRDTDIRGKRVLVRVDFNVAIENGRVRSDARLRASLPTLSWLRERDCAILLCSHLGRPKEGQYDSQYSLAPVAHRLEELASCPVKLLDGPLDSVPQTGAGEVGMLENVRFNEGEKDNDPELAKAYARLCDVFVLDAFGSAHRGHASTLGAAQHAPAACAGLLVEKEVAALRQALDSPQRPVAAIIGGSKTSTKLPVLRSIIEKVDILIPGGGIANNFIAAAGHELGASLWEPDLLDATRSLMEGDCKILIPEDVIVAKSIEPGSEGRACAVGDLAKDDMIVDIGAATSARYCETLAQCKTVVWNGPVGVFEVEAFAAGTRAIAEAIAAGTRQGQLFSIAGGGDTLNAIEDFGIEDISYISTGGGAFLEFIENLTLVALDPLTKN